MSSYLCIYIPIKGKEKEEKIHLIQASRNTDLYQAFSENVSLPYSDNAEVLTNDVLRIIYNDLTSRIDELERQLQNYKLYGKGNLEVINAITEAEKYRNELITARHQINTLEEILMNVIEDGNVLKYYMG